MSGECPRLAFLAVLSCVALAAANEATNEAANEDGLYQRDRAKAKYRRPAMALGHPADNAYTVERAALGKALFFDPRLSRSGTLSCGGCHNPSLSWGDALPQAVGDMMRTLSRRTPTLLNIGYAETLFWDGRAATLEEQALGPIAAVGEMNLSLTEMQQRIRGIAGYRDWFARAYPGEAIVPAVIAKAIAVFERGIVSGIAPVDRWIAGEEDAIDEAAKRGFDLFQAKAGCAQCHIGWNFTDDGFHDIGVCGKDIGRGSVFPQIEAVQAAFKTPTLRNVSMRAPYFHNGSESTLESVIDFYDRGGNAKRPSLAPEVRRLGLTRVEKDDLLRFLLTLNSSDAAVEFPVLPR